MLALGRREKANARGRIISLMAEILGYNGRLLCPSTRKNTLMKPQTEKLSTLKMAWAPDWDAVFDTVGQQRPLIVEIGFGYGHMLLHLAEQFPHANIIGVEVASKPLETVESRLRRLKVANVRVLYGYAETFLHHLLPPASVEQIHINFPDPWFKSGHAHRRVMQRDTVNAIASRLITGGRFYLATDIDEYAEMSDALLRETPALTNLFPTAWADHIDNRVTTKYERKALQEGRTNKYFAYERNTHPAPDVPLIQELEMPNIVFKTQADLTQLPARFERFSQSFPSEDIHIGVMSVFQNEQALMFEAFVKEPTIEQHVGILVVKREVPHEYTLKLAAFGFPRATLGVHRAAQSVEQHLRAFCGDDYAVLHRKVRD